MTVFLHGKELTTIDIRREETDEMAESLLPSQGKPPR